MKRSGLPTLLIGVIIGIAPWASGPVRAEDASKDPDRLTTTFQHVVVHPGTKTPGTNGDIWPVTWADDDVMYTTCSDTDCMGTVTYDETVVGQNVALCRLTGTPEKPSLEPFNDMPQLGLGGLYHGHKGAWKTSGMLSIREAKKLNLDFEDSVGSWKASGILSVKGRLYMAIFHHRYNVETKRWPWWTATDASIISSDDHGVTWNPIPEEAMFEGGRFGNPSFIQYGKDYSLAPDNYVYAISAGEGRWTNNNSYFLGRVPVDSIEERESWSFFSGNSEDDPQWDSLEKAKPIITSQKSLGCGPDIVWHPREKAYILVTFSVPGLPDETAPEATYQHATNAHLTQTVFHMYVAERPWGPWRLVYQGEGPGPVDYCPRISTKWLNTAGEAWLISGGNFGRVPQYADHYGLVVSKMTWGNESPSEKKNANADATK